MKVTTVADTQTLKKHKTQRLSGIPFTDCDDVSEKNKHKNDFWVQSPAESIKLKWPGHLHTFTDTRLLH
jgi:hypothetical protein